jgi:hypothetical protein
MDCAALPSGSPRASRRLLFIHHSCGGQLLAAEGKDCGESCIYESHPNGGGLRDALTEAGYEVHEASYGSVIGADTDLFDWLPKFRDQMDRILRTDRQDQLYCDERRNQIVAFKSCFPNSFFLDEGHPPGDPQGPRLTLWNAKASFEALRSELARHPQILFVYVTAPPLAPRVPPQPVWKLAAKKLLGRPTGEASVRRASRLARQFNDWVKAPSGWLEGYEPGNVRVFDYYDVLTDHGAADTLRYPTGAGTDSHPSAEGNRKAATELVRFVDAAVRERGASGGT